MTINKIIKKLVRQYDTQDPFKIAKEKGIVVLEVPLGEINGFYHRANNIRIIYLNEALSDSKKRFTCAHELGHAILHPSLPSLSLSVTSYMIQRESEANEFATKLLTYNSSDYQFETTADLLTQCGVSEDMERYL